MYYKIITFTARNLALLAISALSLLATSCGDKEDDPVVDEDPKIEITDANKLTANFSIPGASVHEGTPPSPSADANAPRISDASDWGSSNDQIAFAGNSFYLDTYNENGGPVAGVYFQVKGANEYFDIPVTASNERRTQHDPNSRQLSLKLRTNQFTRKSTQINAKLQSDGTVEIPLPENLAPGQFCAAYCVYDAENRVSNIVEFCVIVPEFGGEGSEFLTANDWSAIKELYTENGLTEEELIGATDSYTFELGLGCNPALVATEEWRTDYINVHFDVSGAIKVDSKYYDKWVNYETTSCDSGVQYTELNEESSEVGAWSYNKANNQLTLVVEYEDGGETYSDFEIYEAKLVNGQLVLSINDSDEFGTYNFAIYFDKR